MRILTQKSQIVVTNIPIPICVLLTEICNSLICSDSLAKKLYLPKF